MHKVPHLCRRHWKRQYYDESRCWTEIVETMKCEWQISATASASTHTQTHTLANVNANLIETYEHRWVESNVNFIIFDVPCTRVLFSIAFNRCCCCRRHRLLHLICEPVKSSYPNTYVRKKSHLVGRILSVISVFFLLFHSVVVAVSRHIPPVPATHCVWHSQW